MNFRVAVGFVGDRQQVTTDHWGGEEICVLEGRFEDEQGTYSQGAWLRNPPGSIHTPLSREDCTMYVKTGHLSGRARNLEKDSITWART